MKFDTLNAALRGKTIASVSNTGLPSSDPRIILMLNGADLYITARNDQLIVSLVPPGYGEDEGDAVIVG